MTVQFAPPTIKAMDAVGRRAFLVWEERLAQNAAIYMRIVPQLIRDFREKSIEAWITLLEETAECLEKSGNTGTHERIIDGYASILFFVKRVSQL